MGDATKIVVAQMARVYLGPVGTTAPVDSTSAMAAGWKEVGYFTPDSLKWKTSPQFQEVRSHQSNYPTRRFQTEDGADVEVDLQEWSGDNFLAVYGGGTLTKVGSVYKFQPAAIGGRTEIAAVIEIVDGAKVYRRIIPRCSQTQGVEQTFARKSESTLPLRLSILGSDTVDPWYDLSNDVNMDPTTAVLDNPYFTSITPNTGAAAGGTAVVIAGGNLTGATGVTIGGGAATLFSLVSSTTITCTAPAHVAGATDVVILHPAGNVTATGAFTYV